MTGRYDFANGYGASVINHGYGAGTSTPYEIAVLHGGRIVYDTPITDDVLGWQSAADVKRVLAEIEALPARS